MNKQEITIGGKKFLLDVEKATKRGYLTEQNPLLSHDFQAGDVFKDPTGNTNLFLLVQCAYIDCYLQHYQLLGMGCRINSGPFFAKPRTLAEIKKYLIDSKMLFVRNIHYDIYQLVNK